MLVCPSFFRLTIDRLAAGVLRRFDLAESRRRAAPASKRFFSKDQRTGRKACPDKNYFPAIAAETPTSAVLAVCDGSVLPVRL